MRPAIAICLLLLLKAGTLHAELPLVLDNPREGTETDFRNWLERQVWPDARNRQVSRATFDAALGKTRLDWELPDLLPPGGKAPDGKGQTEFGSPARYFKPSHIDYLLRHGQPLMKEHKKLLDAVEKKYRVPREIILSIWGRESGYGKAKLPHDAVRALATESFMGARKEVFYPELIAALVILEQGHIAPGNMKSSWAGALGHPQFMPSKFLEYAVDFDGDGKRDIWNSVADSLASIGNYLNNFGWNKARDWGFEVDLPNSVSCSLEGPDQGKPITQWRKLGVKRVSDRVFPAAENKRTGFLLMPAGRFGPAFIATENFYVLKQYNESDLYALFIGHLADRMKGGKPFIGEWGEIGAFKRDDVRQMQLRLETEGHDVGGADGLVGFKTRRSIGRWQGANGMTATCFPDAGLVKKVH